MKKNPLRWQYSTLLEHTKKNPTFLPIPHCSILELKGQDQDFVTIAHSHLIHSEWSLLKIMSSGLNPFRTKHVLLRIKRDPVLSLEFFNWVGLHDPCSITMETYSMILHILTKAKRFRTAETLLKENVIPKARKSSTDLFDILLYSYNLCDSSPRVFDSLFKTYAHMKKFRAATETFFRMRDYGFFPTIKSCNAYLSSLLASDRTDIVLSFYREMGHCRISPNAYTLNMVMSALCNSGMLDRALRLFELMERLGINPMVSTFNTLIAGHCRKGLMELALKFKNVMWNKGLQPNVVTYNTLIHGYCKEGKIHDANKIFNEMRAAKIDPNTITYNTLINGCSLVCNTEMSFRLHEEMLKNKIKADIVTYNALILGLCNEGKMKKAAYLVKELDKHNLDPNASTFFALLIGQCKRQNSERALQIFRAMKRCGCHPNIDAFNLLISTFYKNEDLEGAVEILNEMLEGWMTPDETLLIDLFKYIYQRGKTHLVAQLCTKFGGRKIVADCVAKGQLLANQSINQ